MRDLKKKSANDGKYIKEVKKRISGSYVKQDYKIKDDIGVGNTGTTLLAEDVINNKDVVLKVYHVKEAIESGIKEYQMLYRAQSSPNIVRAYNLIYSGDGSMLVISLEDLSKYETLFDFVNTKGYDRFDGVLVSRIYQMEVL